MADLLIRRLPARLVSALKRQAARHRRSVQQEALAILESGVFRGDSQDPVAVAAAIRARLARSGRAFSDSTGLIRRDRGR